MNKIQGFYDIIRENPALWNIFTCREEYSSTAFDQFDRFQYSHSTYKGISNPVVSEHLIRNGFSVEYPENKTFCICLTHDVDEIYPPLHHTLLSSWNCLKKFDFQGLKSQILWKIPDKNKSPYLNFKRIIELEQKYEAHSSFYFLATDQDIRRFRYKIEDPGIELGSITDSGCEVGLHGGFYSYTNLNEISAEKKRLEKVLGRKVAGFRNHYLRFKVPDSWTLLSKAGFEYDSTLGYPDVIGFKNGMCHPFFPYDLNRNNGVNILELPLALMDTTLFSSLKTYEETWENVKQCIDTVEKYHGVLTINWHSNSFNCPFKRHWESIYQKILEYSFKKNAWMANGITLSNFLKTTNKWYYD
jgi:peptidoglycan/xylan/chitin deacetylase (PgdA/CDA1 family)